jgi:hypothetical protein
MSTAANHARRLARLGEAKASAQQQREDEASWRESEKRWQEKLAEVEQARELAGTGDSPAAASPAADPAPSSLDGPAPFDPATRRWAPVTLDPHRVYTTEEIIALNLPMSFTPPAGYPPGAVSYPPGGLRPGQHRTPKGWVAPWPNGDFIFPGHVLGPLEEEKPASGETAPLSDERKKP